MKQLPINLDELAYLLHRGQTIDMASYFHLTTGEIINIPTERKILRKLVPEVDNGWQFAAEDLVRKILPEESEDLIEIPNLLQQHVFGLMSGFISTIADGFPAEAAKLEMTIHKNGSYADFRKILDHNKKILKKYITYRDIFFEQSAIEWLKTYEIEVL